ncbi:capsid protein precursor [San Miguel sea lion virus 8]|uniref:capsid protein precursor n=1 Tax=San Miguel sea lion virus 8 TaxID=1564182 RepID=UPI00052A3A8F|nr:capsid protein precursor [San Miguel sea lion virus 8]AIU47326.1 capsid protein precursor [San Miguel sea lion virus 8]
MASSTSSPKWSSSSDEFDDCNYTYECECIDCTQKKEFDAQLASKFGWEKCPSGTLEFFYDPEDTYCDDPFHCCHPEVLDELGQEFYCGRTNPELEALYHTVQNPNVWETGWTKPTAPPFNLGDGFYMAFKPGAIMHQCIQAVAKSWDPSLPSEDKEPLVFRAESEISGDPAITTEEQGVAVATGPQPSAASMNTLAVAATGATPGEEWRTFFAYSTNIRWSTDDGNGKVLYQQLLSPRLNPYLKFLSQIYSGWSGSIDVRFSISGSGIYGRKLAAVVIPPGIDPSGGTNILQFPHVMFDARATEPVILNIPDIRRNLWHGMNDVDTPYLVIVVYNELINPYQGTNGVASGCTVTVETKPGVDFQFNLLKPPGRLLRSGKEPSDLIPRSSLLWTGNRLPGDVVTFAINPTIGQANRHFDSNRFTSGWSTPQHGDILLRATGAPNKRVLLASHRDGNALVPGVPDGWPDYIPPSNWGVTPTDLSTYDTLKYGLVSACLEYSGNNQGRGSIAEHAVIGVGTVSYASGSTPNGTVTPSRQIWAQTLAFVYPKEISGTKKFKVRPMMCIRENAQAGPIGDKLDRVAYYDKLPTATTRNGNYPLYFVSLFMSNYGNDGVQCYNSQLLSTSAAFAADNYDIGPEAFAVYRIKDSAGKWFDVGIAADGFAYVGSFVLDFAALQAPYTSSYMGIQSAGNPLAHNITAGTQRQL